MAATIQSFSVKTRFVVMQRRPLDSLPRWKRWLVRRVYKIVNWQTADGEEMQAICDTEAIAKAICAAGGSNWFYHELPMNVSLPAQTTTFKGVRFPLSDASEFYERVGAKRARTQIVVCPFTRELCSPHDTINQSDLQETARRLKVAADA